MRDKGYRARLQVFLVNLKREFLVGDQGDRLVLSKFRVVWRYQS